MSAKAVRKDMRFPVLYLFFDSSDPVYGNVHASRNVAAQKLRIIPHVKQYSPRCAPEFVKLT